jgi:hypothetical protein
MMPPSWVNPSESELDEFPDLDTLVHRARQGKKTTAQPVTKVSSVRRRKLVALADNVLLKPWTEEPASQPRLDLQPSTADIIEPTSRPRVQLRTSKQVSTAKAAATDNGRHKEGRNASDEKVFPEEASSDDSSKLHDRISLDLDDSDDLEDGPRLQHRGKADTSCKQSGLPRRGGTLPRRTTSPRKVEQPGAADKAGKRQRKEMALTCISGTDIPEKDLVGAINRLRM